MTTTTGAASLTARSDTSSGRPDEGAAERGRERLARLADRAGTLRSRGGGPGTSDRWLLVVGGTAMPLGLLLIVLGWYGASKTVLPFEQTPYLISGGLLGLALVIGGGFLYFAYWLTLDVRESRRERERVTAHQERLERLLVELTGRLSGPSSTPGAERVVATPKGTLLHRPECVAARGLDVVDVLEAQPGFALCGLCQPVAPPAALPVEVPAAAPVRRPRPARTAR